jgi:hypothetical protein
LVLSALLYHASVHQDSRSPETLQHEAETARQLAIRIANPNEASSDSVIAAIGLLAATGVWFQRFPIRPPSLTYLVDTEYYRERRQRTPSLGCSAEVDQTERWSTGSRMGRCLGYGVVNVSALNLWLN